MQIRWQAGFLLLAALLVAPLASAGEVAVPTLGPAACQGSETAHCQPSTDAGPAAAPDAPAPDLKLPKASFLDGLTAFFADVGGAAAAAGASAVAAGAALTGALRTWAEFLITLRPAAMSAPLFLGLATAATATAAFASQFSLWYALRRLLPWLGLVPGFSRIAKAELLDNEHRSRLYEMIRHSPGIRLGDLARGTGLAWGTAIHHLRKLRADRLITFQVVGRHKCFFINGSGLTSSEVQAASLVQGKTVEGIAAWIERHPKTTLKDLAAGLGISAPLAAFHVGKLEKAGLVSKVRDGRTVRLASAAGRLCPPGMMDAVGMAAPMPSAL